MSNKLFRIHLTLPKKNSAFLYFILESYEGLVFYSTLDHQIGQLSREMEIYCPRENFADFEILFQELISILDIEVNSTQSL